jgi:hypothetical protein
VGGIGWLDDLVSQGQAVRRGDGYPYGFLARAGAVRPFLVQRPYEKKPVSQQFLDLDAVESIDPEEWVYAEVWDGS